MRKRKWTTQKERRVILKRVLPALRHAYGFDTPPIPYDCALCHDTPVVIDRHPTRMEKDTLGCPNCGCHMPIAERRVWQRLGAMRAVLDAQLGFDELEE